MKWQGTHTRRIIRTGNYSSGDSKSQGCSSAKSQFLRERRNGFLGQKLSRMPIAAASQCATKPNRPKPRVDIRRRNRHTPNQEGGAGQRERARVRKDQRKLEALH